MALYEGERAVAFFLEDCKGCDYLERAVQDATEEARRLSETAESSSTSLYISSAHGVCECANVGVTVWMIRDPATNGVIVGLIGVTERWWEHCAALNPQ